MNAELLSAIPPLAALVPLFLLHLAIHRLARIDSLIRSFLISFVIVAPVYLVFGIHGLLEERMSWDAVLDLATNLTLFLGWAFIYIDSMNFGECSIRTRILDEIDRHPRHGLDRKGLLEQYDAREVIDLRIGRLTGNGQLSEVEGRLHIGPHRRRQLILARTFHSLRRILFATDELTSRSTRSR